MEAVSKLAGNSTITTDGGTNQLTGNANIKTITNAMIQCNTFMDSG